MEMQHDIHTRTATGELDPSDRALLGAIRTGFNQGASSEENDQRWWATSVQDAHRFRYATRRPLVTGLGLDERPVATFGSFTHTVNVGGGRLLEADFITDVTVRTTDRRQGLLRRMMTDELTCARDQGLALATLTASEGSIYGRFGFGVATRAQRVEVEASERFQLRRQPAAVVEQADPPAIADLLERLHAEAHARYRGSHQPPAFRRAWLSGEWDWDTMAASTKLRAAVAVRDGQVVGALTHELTDEAEHTTVLDLVGDDDAALALWQHLARLDLVSTIRYGCLQDGSPLRAALVDQRVVTTKADRDQCWLRLLDVPRALAERGWDGDGEVVLKVGDPMGLADGCSRLHVSQGRATVEAAAADQAEVDCPVDALAEAYLGLTSIAVLAAAGRVTGEPEAMRRLGRMLAVDRPPRNSIVF
ncbi:GNAT family N-acetyltransferase [Luteococcus peritonei]|uniref:GNAT family N-acetyltransferase n=1 Tax=Luteococcus peritonei TaxID=88874 RepID=A0ABW4RW61_9ACTN